MRVAVRMKKGVRMRMKTRAVKRAWSTQTPTLKKRVRGLGLGRCCLRPVAMVGLLIRTRLPKKKFGWIWVGSGLPESSETTSLDRAQTPG